MRNKNIIRIYIVFLFLISLIIFYSLIYTRNMGSTLKINFSAIIFCGVIIPITLIISNKIRFNNIVKKTSKTIYYREPPFNYSPVIVTYIENLKIELKKDIIAEICFLKNKGILDIKTINGKYYIKRIDNKECELMSSQIYLLNKIPIEGVWLNELIESIKKDKRNLEKCYEKDCIELGYITKGDIIYNLNEKILDIVTFMLCVIFLGSTVIPVILTQSGQPIISILTMISLVTFTLLLLAIPVSLAYVYPIILIFDKFIKLRTKKATQEYSHWKAFISFLKEYTLIEEKELGNIEIWNEYLTYAIAFKITKINDV